MCRKLIRLAAIGLVLGLAVTIANADIQTGLVSHWKLDETSGTTAKDSAGGNNGTLIGNATWTEGWLSGAVEFDGEGDYIDCGNSSTFDLRDAVTLSAWVKPDLDFAYPNWSGIIHKGSVVDFDTFAFYYDGRTNRQLGFKTGDTSPNTWYPIPAPDLFDGDWHHAAAVYDGSTKSIYLDGELLGTAASTGQIRTSNGRCLLGAGRDYNPPTHYVAGKLDDARIYSWALMQEDIQQVMIGTPPGTAFDPSPADGATDVPREVVLSWTPGEFAPPVNGHKVYFSENFNDVNDGVGGIAQDASSYDPGRLDWGTAYYWRVDEVNGPPDYTVFEGEVWSFTTELLAYPIADVTATASSSAVAKGPENTVNGSGLDESGLLHDKAGDDAMWLSDIAGPQPSWIQFEFDKVYKMHELWVWNSNEFLEPMVGFGFKDVTIEYSVDGTNYTTVGTTHEFARAPGTSGYAHNTTVEFGGVAAKYVKLTANSNWGGLLNQYGLSEIRFLHIPVSAREPYPDSGATDVDVDVTLSWQAGREAAKHDVYVSTDEQAVIDSTAPATIVTEASHGPLSLDLAQTYYWKVNEVNEAETPAMWQGTVWNFATHAYLVVDDFESYNDLDGYLKRG
jgi:hypothetical protein